MRFPISTFERFFTSSLVREKWGLVFEGSDFKIISIRKSFLNAYAEVVKRMALDKKEPRKVDSRVIHNKELIQILLSQLPTVFFPTDDEEEGDSDSGDSKEDKGSSEGEKKSDGSGQSSDNPPPKPVTKPAKDDPNRRRLIHRSFSIESDKFRIQDMFNELKKIPVFSYPNAVGASIRIFLDLAIREYIEREKLEDDIQKHYKKNLIGITLSNRLEYIKQNSSLNTKVKNDISKLLNPSDTFTLDVLNGYQHSTDNHHLTPQYLNRFWAFLLPLLKELVVIKENGK